MIYQGDALAVLKTLPDESVQCCVTSPPYCGLRDYGVDGQLGLEKTPEEYVAKMVEIFREVRRVLRSDGTLWLNIGDSYAGSGRGWSHTEKQMSNRGSLEFSKLVAVGSGRPDNYISSTQPNGLKPKDLCMIPARVALALWADGWWVRSDIIWAKPNPMPESVTDRPTKAHEYIFLMSKSAKYYYDAEAIKEPVTNSSLLRLGQDIEHQKGSNRVPGKTNGPMKAVRFGGNKAEGYGTRIHSGKEWSPKNLQSDGQQPNTMHINRANGDGEAGNGISRNKRDVWTVATQPYSEAHFATFPEKLIEPCILAGCPERGIVLDPFLGSGTTAAVALRLNRQFVGIELNPEYIELAEKRIAPLLAQTRLDFKVEVK